MRQGFVFEIVGDLLEAVNATLTIDGDYAGTLVVRSQALLLIATALRRQGVTTEVLDRRDGSEWSIRP